MSPNFRAASLELDLGALGVCTATAVYHTTGRHIQSVILHRDDQRDLEVEASLSWFTEADRIKIEEAVEKDATGSEIEAGDLANELLRDFDRAAARAINGGAA